MSKNKKVEAVKTEKQGMKKSTKAIIAAAVAVVLVAAVLVGIFVIKPAIEKKPDGGNTDITFTDTEQNEGENYEYVNFKGTRMAKDLALILEQAEKDDKAGNDKFGAAFKMGDYEISKGELALYYMDEHSVKSFEIQQSISSKGQNFTGYETTMVPSQQKYPGGDYQWSDKFVSDAKENIKNVYATFDLAIKEGITLTENDIYTLIMSYERAKRAADVNESPDALIERIYGEGATYAMFARREIMQKYAVEFETRKNQEYFDSVTDEEIKAEFDKDPDLYKAIDVRVYPIQGEYEPAEISAVNTEQEFLDFAKKNYPQENYNAEIITKIFNTTKSQLSATFGDEVGEWAFASDRVEGEVALINGQLYQYLVYIKSLPVYDYSHDIIIYNYPFESGETAEEKDAVYEEKEKLFKEIEGKQISADDFLQKFDNIDYGCVQQSARAGDFYFEVVDWMLEEGRKEGDTAFFASNDSGIFAVYYIKPNPDDLDWQNSIRTELSNQKYMAEYEAFVADYEIKENKKTVEKVINDADAIIQKKIDEEAKNQ